MIERAIGIMNDVRKTKGLVITDHQYRYVTSCSDRLYFMVNGKIHKLAHKDELKHFNYYS